MSGATAGAGEAVGVLLMTFGSAVTSADVPDYLRSVRGGREPSDDLVTEFRRRFDTIGRSPLIDITLAQASALEALLTERHGVGRFVVRAGMLHSEPRVAPAVGELTAAGAARVVAVVLAPQFSPLILSGYQRALDEAAPAVPVHLAGSWHLTPSWLASLAERVGEALDTLPPSVRSSAGIVFTTHSLPRPVVDRDPAYMEQIRATIDEVAARAGLEAGAWTFAFQSAGHSPEEWLRPDLTEVLPGLRERGLDDVLVVPVQFVADHLEILYDIDVAAAAQAAAVGLRFHRIRMPNTSPRFVTALAEVVERELAAAAA